MAFGVSLWSNEGDNDVRQPSLNYNCVVLDVGWNVGLGEMHPIPCAYLKTTISRLAYKGKSHFLGRFSASSHGNVKHVEALAVIFLCSLLF